MSTLAEEQRRLPGLDGVRGIAIAVVMFYHFYENFNGPHWWDKGIYYIVELGWSGVDLFFVLSGFLITRNLLEAKGSPYYFRNFYVRRILRIFPLYYGTLVLFFFILPLFFHSWNREEIALYRDNQYWFWFHLSNLFSFRTGNQGFLYHFWSLAIEEQFYLLWPAVLFLCKRKHIPRVCAAFCAMGIVFRGITFYIGYDTHAVHILLPARFDTLAIGGFLACLDWKESLAICRKGPFIVGAGVSVVALCIILESVLPSARWMKHTVYFTVLAMIFAYLIVAVLTFPTESILQRLVGGRILQRLGKHSYALYIFHTVIEHSFPVSTEAFLRTIPIPLLAGILYALAVGSTSFLVSLVSWELCERRFLALKGYFSVRAARSPRVMLAS